MKAPVLADVHHADVSVCRTLYPCRLQGIRGQPSKKHVFPSGNDGIFLHSDFFL